MCFINKIFWKRTYLFVEIKASLLEKLYLKNMQSGRMVPFDIKKLKDNYYRGKLNITIANGRELLEEGTWLIVDGDGNAIKEYSSCFSENHFIGQRVFRYTKRFYSYAFRLECNENGISIINGHYMSVKKEKDEEKFKESFFNFQ